MIKANYVVSSNIDAVGYRYGKLYVRFLRTGLVYVYHKVSFATFFSLLNAESAGKFFNKYIKPAYSFDKLDYDPFEAKI